MRYNHSMHKRLLNTTRTRGFTLVELMVVVAVIGILLTVMILGYRQVQNQARDSQREAAASAIATSLEAYYEKNGEYPAGIQFNAASQRDYITNYAPTLSVLSQLSEKDLSKPGSFQFYAYCNGTTCDAGSFLTVRREQIIYHSRNSTNNVAGSFYKLTMNQASGGPNCSITTYYTDPGYALFWYSEAQGIWIFKKSKHGSVDIANNGTPTAPQTCTFS